MYKILCLEKFEIAGMTFNITLKSSNNKLCG